MKRLLLILLFLAPCLAHAQTGREILGELIQPGNWAVDSSHVDASGNIHRQMIYVPDSTNMAWARVTPDGNQVWLAYINTDWYFALLGSDPDSLPTVPGQLIFSPSTLNQIGQFIPDLPTIIGLQQARQNFFGN